MLGISTLEKGDTIFLHFPYWNNYPENVIFGINYLKILSPEPLRHFVNNNAYADKIDIDKNIELSKDYISNNVDDIESSKRREKHLVLLLSFKKKIESSPQLKDDFDKLSKIPIVVFFEQFEELQSSHPESMVETFKAGKVNLIFCKDDSLECLKLVLNRWNIPPISLHSFSKLKELDGLESAEERKNQFQLLSEPNIKTN
ncbi:MAG: hypothetical protein RLZZ210_1649 [Pseudomonadota bacterium]|jgi:hypothetical protein